MLHMSITLSSAAKSPSLERPTLPGNPGKPDPRRRAFPQYLAAETELLRRTAAGFARQPPCALDKPLRFDQAAEILLMQANARQGLDRALQLQEREFRGHQLEHHRPV